MEFRRNFLRNSAGIFYGIPPEFFTEFRQNFRGTRNSVKKIPRNSAEFYSGGKFPRNSAEFFHGIPRNFSGGIFFGIAEFSMRNSAEL